MQRIQKWGGLVTQASPYAVPPGGATQQCNFMLSKPGQLTSRGGMRLMGDPLNAGGTDLVEQMWVISGGVGKADTVLTLDASGNLYLIPAVT
jgi:hypothetical protein